LWQREPCRDDSRVQSWEWLHPPQFPISRHSHEAHSSYAAATTKSWDCVSLMRLRSCWQREHPQFGSEFEQVVVHNVHYLRTVSLASGDAVCVKVEHKVDRSRWRGEFTARCKSCSQRKPVLCSTVHSSLCCRLPAEMSPLGPPRPQENGEELLVSIIVDIHSQKLLRNFTRWVFISSFPCEATRTYVTRNQLRVYSHTGAWLIFRLPTIFLPRFQPLTQPAVCGSDSLVIKDFFLSPVILPMARVVV
jgi:hypothetical protein